MGGGILRVTGFCNLCDCSRRNARAGGLAADGRLHWRQRKHAGGGTAGAGGGLGPGCAPPSPCWAGGAMRGGFAGDAIAFGSALWGRGVCPAPHPHRGGSWSAGWCPGSIPGPSRSLWRCSAPPTIALVTLAALSGELIDLVALPAFVLCTEPSWCQREPVPALGWPQPPRLWSPGEVNCSAQAELENQACGAWRERLGRAGMGFSGWRRAGSSPPLQLSFLSGFPRAVARPQR